MSVAVDVSAAAAPFPAPPAVSETDALGLEDCVAVLHFHLRHVQLLRSQKTHAKLILAERVLRLQPAPCGCSARGKSANHTAQWLSTTVAGSVFTPTLRYRAEIAWHMNQCEVLTHIALEQNALMHLAAIALKARHEHEHVNRECNSNAVHTLCENNLAHAQSAAHACPQA